MSLAPDPLILNEDLSIKSRRLNELLIAIIAAINAGGGGGGGISALTGDVTASGAGSVAATIAALAVTYAKMQNVTATSRVLGRKSASAGVIEELTAADLFTLLGNSFSRWNNLARGPFVGIEYNPSNGLTSALCLSGATSSILGTTSTTGAIDRMFEVRVGPNTNQTIGVATSILPLTGYVGQSAAGWAYFGTNGHKFNSTDVVYGASYGAGDWIGVRVDASGNVIFYKNGVSQGTAFTGLSGTVLFPAFGNGSTAGTSLGELNTGLQPFAFPIGGVSAWG